jgi:hypothetical protein
MTGRKILKVEKHGKRVKPKPKIRHFRLGEGLPTPDLIASELQDMTDVLLGRVEPPIDKGFMTLHEVADAYFARASEITMLIQQAERDGRVTKSGAHYKIRTGELRTFLEMAKRAADLGSRRVTAESLRQEREIRGRESMGEV